MPLPYFFVHQLVKENEFDSEITYQKFLTQKKNWCQNITKPIDEQSIQLRAKLVCQQLVGEEWQTIEETEYGI